MILRLGEKGII